MAAPKREHQRLDEQLPEDAPVAGAERDPHRDIARADHAAREQQTGDVDARHEQQQRRSRENDHQRRAERADDGVDQRPHPEHAIAVRRRKLLLQRGRAA